MCTFLYTVCLLLLLGRRKLILVATVLPVDLVILKVAPACTVGTPDRIVHSSGMHINTQPLVNLEVWGTTQGTECCCLASQDLFPC